MRKNIPEWIKSIPRHKMEEALMTVSDMAKTAKEEARGPTAPSSRAIENLRYYEGRRDGLADVLVEFERHTVMASVQKRKAKEPV